MNTIRIRKKIDSETICLPELKPLIGKTVEIVVQEDPVSAVTPGTGDWEALREAARATTEKDWEDFFAQGGPIDIDPGMVTEYRDFDKRQNVVPDL